MMQTFVVVVAAAVLLSGCQQSQKVASEPTPTVSESQVARSEKTESKAEPDYADEGKQVAWIERGKETIKAKLRDPDSATFRNVTFHSGGGVPVACGEVNANNGFGGKAGYERFLAAGSSLAVLESEMTTSAEFDEVADRFCKG